MKNPKNNIGRIAELCGVSMSTISRYFNQPDLVSEKTQKKIETILKSHDYQPNSYASVWNANKDTEAEKPFVLVIFPHLQFGFYSELLNQLIEEGKKTGIILIPYTSTISKEDELRKIKQLCKFPLKGIILLSPRLSSKIIESIPVPVITIEREGGNFMQINNDNFNGGKLAGEKLLADGCDIFVHINNDYTNIWPSFKRILGFECTLEGKLYKRIIDKSLTRPSEKKALEAMQNIVHSLLEEFGKDHKWGVFCSNDDIARLFEQQCIREGLSIPNQVEIIGYDNSPVSEHAAYPITSVDQNISLMAHLAINGFENYLPCETIVPSRLIEKKTTAQ